MKLSRIISGIVIAFGIVGLSFATYTAKVENRKLAERARVDRAALTAEVAAKNQTIESLNGNVEQTANALTNSVRELTKAKAKLIELGKSYQEAAQVLQKAEETKNLLAQIPPPTITTTRNASGAEERIFQFPEVRDASNHLRARNAVFARLSGRRLTFRPAEGVSIMLDIDDVHPAILAYLDIDVGKAKAAQVAADTAWLWKGVNEQREAVEMAQRAQVQQEIDERLRIEQAKANAEIAKANAQEQATREAAYNERVKAEAAARMADAAMIEASKPAASVNVIQQQQQQQ